MTCLRLILGDQLNARHTWFRGVHADVVQVFMEVRSETDYVRHHAQKVLGIFAAMRRFADALQRAGHRVGAPTPGWPACARPLASRWRWATPTTSSG